MRGFGSRVAVGSKSNQGLVKDIRRLNVLAGRLAWSPDGDTILFDKTDTDTYFDLWTMSSVGGSPTCKTCGAVSPFTSHHISQPAWHPSGQWVCFQAQKDTYTGGAEDILASPGSGIQNNLFISPADFSTTTLVFLVPASNPLGGALHPHFNHQGNLLGWGDRLGNGTGDLGHWRIIVADFVVTGTTPSLANGRAYDVGARPDWCEFHGFHPKDDNILLFSGNPEGQHELNPNIYTYNRTTGVVTNLSNNFFWNEHAHYSPSGDHIVWMHGLKEYVTLGALESEFYIMRSDGSHQTRLTYFHEPGHPHFLATSSVVAADSDWSPDGSKIAGFVQITGAMGSIVVIDLNTGQLP